MVDWAKYVTIAIGLALVGLGVAMLLGYRLPFTTPRLDKGGRDRTVGSMFVFGVSYAVASIGCTLPLFIGALLTELHPRRHRPALLGWWSTASAWPSCSPPSP